MERRVALCVDGVACRNPQAIGLEGEVIDAQEWLAVFTEGANARSSLAHADAIEEVWVVSCDDVEPINLAATLKSDIPRLRVCLIAPEVCGSLFSRAHTAQIDEVIEATAFPKKYSAAKLRMRGGSDACSLPDGMSLGVSRDVPTGALGGISTIASQNISAGISGGAPAGVSAGFSTGVSGGVTAGAPSGIATGVSSGVSTGVSGGFATGVMPGGGEVPIACMTNGTPGAAVLDGPSVLSKPTVAERVDAHPIAGYMPVSASNRAFILTVVSGSGGAGKSSVSALGSVIAQKMGLKTLLLDCDLQFGDVAGMVGEDKPLRIDDALAHSERIEVDLVRAGSLSVLAAPSRLEASEEIVRSLPGLLERLSKLFDVIVVNTGATWAEQHALLLERSSAVLFLVDQRVSSVKACQHALELCARCGIASSPFQFALNRCSKNAPLSSIDVSCALQGVSIYELKDGGRDVEDYLSSGSAGELLEMKNEFAKSLELVMERLLPAGDRRVAERVLEVEDRRPSRRWGRRSGRRRGEK